MKTASVLLGLAVSAAGAGLAVSAVGAAHACPAKHAEVAHAQATAPAGHGIRAAMAALLRAPIALHAIKLTARPLVDADGDVLCGNVMGKGSAHHVCRNRQTGEIVSDTKVPR